MTTSIPPIPVHGPADVALVWYAVSGIARQFGCDDEGRIRIASAACDFARRSTDVGGHTNLTFAVVAGHPAELIVEIHDSHAEGDRCVSGSHRAPLPGLVSTSGDAAGDYGTCFPRCLRLPLGTGDAAVSLQLAAIPLPDRASGMGDDDLLALSRVVAQLMAENAEQIEEVERLRGELEETNRGVVALYAELDEKARQLEAASEQKSRFLSYLSHEFRTSLSAIGILSGLLLDRVDGDLTPEQEKQVKMIGKSAAGLSDMVNDLLDRAKIEAGLMTVRPTRFLVDDVFESLQGMFSQGSARPGVELLIERVVALPDMESDQEKVSQILRNLVSNALKFTTRGEVRVSASASSGDRIRFHVRDTGIGIAPEDQERIFHEFSQLESPLQAGVKGTGLGLPLTRKLVELLGGSIVVESEPGSGTAFTVTLPRRMNPEAETSEGTREVG